MNLKYYLRGLGLGIIVTAVIMGAVLGGKKEELSNEEIIMKAKALGMMEDKVLSQYGEGVEAEPEDIQTEPETQKSIPDTEDRVQDAPIQGEGVEQEEDAAIERGAESESIENEDLLQDGMSEEKSQGENKEPETQPEEQVAGELKEFTIIKGDGSHIVSQRLAEAGLVSSAVEFDHFLIQNGYDKKIVASDFEIPMGSDFDAVARIITGR